MTTRDKHTKKRRTAREIFRRHEKRCERCGRKIKAGRYCYYCGRFKGLW